MGSFREVFGFKCEFVETIGMCTYSVWHKIKADVYNRLCSLNLVTTFGTLRVKIC